jgi:hypothetical protein
MCVVYKKYHNYVQAVTDYQAAMRDVHPSHAPAPPLPYDPITYEAFLQSFLLMVVVRVVGGRRC